MSAPAVEVIALILDDDPWSADIAGVRRSGEEGKEGAERGMERRVGRLDVQEMCVDVQESAG